MCEKISGFKTFAHIFVCSYPSLQDGFYFVYAIPVLLSSLADIASHDLKYNSGQKQT